MFQFYITNQKMVDNEVYIVGEDFKHMKQVVRLREGEQFRVSNEKGESFICSLDHYGESEAVGNIEEVSPSTELAGEVILFQGLPKGDKMELIIQKAVELGVTKIVPVSMTNCVVRLNEKKEQAKIKRWQAIAQAAAQQSKRSVIPLIIPVMNFKEALAYGANLDCRLVPYESKSGVTGGKIRISLLEPNQSVGIYIGPEGGFSPEEIDLVPEEELISLGRRILRTETAAITTLSLVMYQMETDSKLNQTIETMKEDN